jgi:predicted aldo/keto reductase-like oxidoreductase
MSIERRQFLRHGIAAGAALAAGLRAHRAQGATLPRRHANDVIELGPDKVKLSRLAMGTGTSGFGGSSSQTRQLGVKGIADLLWFGYDNGVTFWDSADQYGSHPHLKAGLKNVAREKVAIMTKTHAKTSDEMKRDLDRFKTEIGTDYIDIVLLHAVREADWPEQRKGAMEYLSEMREKGVVKTHGLSCHSLPALQTAAKTPWVHVDLARINPMGVAMDADPATVREVLREMKRNGKGVIGMKILGEGRMRNRVDEMLAHALAMEFVDVFTIGAENVLELGDLIRRIPDASQRGWPVEA